MPFITILKLSRWCVWPYPCADLEGGQDTPPPMKNHKNKGFLSNTGPDHLKNHNATKPAFIVGGTMMARFEWYFDPIYPYQSKKNVGRVGPHLTKLSGSAHDISWYPPSHRIAKSKGRCTSTIPKVFRGDMSPCFVALKLNTTFL